MGDWTNDGSTLFNFVQLLQVLFAAGCDVVVERVGGERQQALLRRHPFPITALAHHPVRLFQFSYWQL